MYVICAGMYRAGSTWQYQVVSHIAENFLQGKTLGFLNADDLANKTYMAEQICVLKTHNAHSKFSNWLNTGQAIAVYCYRDLRDVAYSLAHMFRTDLDGILGERDPTLPGERRPMKTVLENDEFWRKQRNTLTQRFEDMVAFPDRAVRQIARHLNVNLSNNEVHLISGLFSLSENKKRILSFRGELQKNNIDPRQHTNGFLWDKRNLLHWNHIRTGKVGAWRKESTLRHRVKLALVCGEWLIANNYEATDDWICNDGRTIPVQTIEQLAADLRDEFAGDVPRLNRLNQICKQLSNNRGRSLLRRVWKWLSGKHKAG